MRRTITVAVIYTFILILASIFAVVMNLSLHEKFLQGEQARENNEIFIQYFQTGSPLEMANIQGITENEVEHIYDVRQLLVIGSFLVLALGLLLLLLWEKTQHKIIIFVSPLILAYLSLPSILLAKFDVLFDVFHRVLFTQGNYTFSSTSVLISTYPSSFFAQMSLSIATYFLASSAVLLFIKIIGDKIYLLTHRSESID